MFIEENWTNHAEDASWWHREAIWTQEVRMKGLPAASLKVMSEAFFFLQYLLEFENC